MTPSSAERASVPNAAIDKEHVVYRRVGETELQATLYRPSGCRSWAGVVSVHGGRWSAEDRFTNARIDRALAAAGITVMAIDFRLAPSAQYPAPVSDINAAIRWLKTQAEGLGIPEGTIGGVGTSSGGHQLLLNALLPLHAEYVTGSFAGEPSSRERDASLAFVIAGWAVVDPLERYRYAVERGMQLHVDCHHAYFADELAMAAGNPQRIVRQRSATHLPALLLIQGGDDKIVLPNMTECFAQSYSKAGGQVMVKSFAGEGHTFMTKQPNSAATRAALSDMITFISAQTK